LDTNCMYVT